MQHNLERNKREVGREEEGGGLGTRLSVDMLTWIVKVTSSANSEGKVNDCGTSFDYNTMSSLKCNILASQTSMKL